MKLSVADAAKKLGVTGRTLRRYIAQGAPHHEGERGYEVEVAAIRTWMEERGLIESDAATPLKDSLLKARLNQVNESTELVKLKRQIAAGELVSVSEVRSEEMRRVAQVRDGLLALADTLPPKLDGLTRDEMREVIQADVYRLLDEYSRGRVEDV